MRLRLVHADVSFLQKKKEVRPAAQAIPATSVSLDKIRLD